MKLRHLLTEIKQLILSEKQEVICNSVGENRGLEVIPSIELNKLLCSF